MRLRKVSVRNIRAIEFLEWTLPRNGRWNVVLGENGSGKSSFLRAVALAMIGPKEAVAARQDWNTWIRMGSAKAEASVKFTADSGFDGVSGEWAGQTLQAGVQLSSASGTVTLTERKEPDQTVSAARHLWKNGPGWFCVSYGPFRRFSGGDKDAERIYKTNPRIGAHLTVFYDSVALCEVLTWLRDLKFKQLDSTPGGELLDYVVDFVNQPGFLPHDVRLTEVTASGVRLQTTDGDGIAIEELSDGYRSMLSMTFELIRQMARRFEPDKIFSKDRKKIVVPGVVLIDEVDAHLHPTWQKTIGYWFTERFPKMQFIVTTHSPLVCHAAINGSVFVMARPGESDGRMLKGAELNRLIYGDVQDAYSTGVFGEGGTRSEQADELMQRLADLNVKEIREGLSSGERAEQQQLRATFPVFPMPTSGV
jgi:predicted ATPase